MPKELFAGSQHSTPYIPKFGISKSYGMMVIASICWSIAVCQIFPFTVLCILRLEQCECGRALGDCHIYSKPEFEKVVVKAVGNCIHVCSRLDVLSVGVASII
jgi:hypothetical protein